MVPAGLERAERCRGQGRNPGGLAPALAHFQTQTGAPHAFQAVLNLPYESVDCFAAGRPAVVPARTLLSQLL